MLRKNLSDKDLENKFKEYLIFLELRKNTVHSYCSWIIKICRKEKISLLELAKNINNFVLKHDIGGPEESYGNKGHRSVINALKKYSDFSNSLGISKK